MRTTMTQAATIVSGLSTEDKIRLVSGSDFWHTEGLADVERIMLTDGPHGLRKQAGDTDHVGLADSVPATCFPTAVTLGSTWDPALLEEVGAALGRECRVENVGVLLGPGLNIKRHGAGGRSFEYFSEDPFVAGHMAAALVRGIQSEGVGACLKHYAANNQEHHRMNTDAVIDERTLREIYLTGFELAVKGSDPWTVMCSYNKVNGTHTGESRELLTDILRDEWGFDGLVMTDWLATFDRPAGIAAGLDLEMPGSKGTWDALVAKALESGELTDAELSLAATRVVDLILRRHETPELDGFDIDAHHAIARRAAAAGSVLLTNDGLLPLAATGTIAVIGAFAETPRYQGAGSSLVKPTRVDTLLDSLRERAAGSATVTYAPGYDARTGDSTAELLAEASAAASAADVVVLLIGLPASKESEGYDRPHLRLPDAHDALVAVVTDANPRTAVVLANGAAVTVPWAKRPAAILEAYLGGQAGGSAIADVILGATEPGGRLAESFPMSADDLPSDANFPGSDAQVEYREGLYVGYRFHDAAGVAPRFAFGHGLSYTTFEYSGMSVRKSGDGYKVSLTVTNTGSRAGSDVVQVYVRDVESTVYRPVKELKGFAKVHLEAGASEKVIVSLDHRAFAVWDVAAHDWLVEAGDFEVLVGASSADIRLSKTVKVASEDKVSPAAGPSAFVASDAEFAAMLGHPIPAASPSLPFHRDSSLGSLTQTTAGRRVYAVLLKNITKQFGGLADDHDQAGMVAAMLQEMPLRGLAMASEGKLSLGSVERLITILNGASIKALRAR